MRIVRLTLSCVVAFVLVGTLVAIAIDRYQKGEAVSNVIAHKIDRLSTEERDAILKMLEDESEPEPPPPPPAPVFELPERAAPGFVQLEYSVQPDGSVANIRVVGAVPEGRFDAQARAIVAARRYAPDLIDGKPVASTRSEVINFNGSAPDEGGSGR